MSINFSYRKVINPGDAQLPTCSSLQPIGYIYCLCLSVTELSNSTGYMWVLKSGLGVVDIPCFIGFLIGFLIGSGLLVHSCTESVRMEEWRSDNRPALTYARIALLKLNKVGLEDELHPGCWLVSWGN